jgi:hypothetical protein
MISWSLFKGETTMVFRYLTNNDLEIKYKNPKSTIRILEKNFSDDCYNRLANSRWNNIDPEFHNKLHQFVVPFTSGRRWAFIMHNDWSHRNHFLIKDNINDMFLLMSKFGHRYNL